MVYPEGHSNSLIEENWEELTIWVMLYNISQEALNTFLTIWKKFGIQGLPDDARALVSASQKPRYPAGRHSSDDIFHLHTHGGKQLWIPSLSREEWPGRKLATADDFEICQRFRSIRNATFRLFFFMSETYIMKAALTSRQISRTIFQYVSIISRVCKHSESSF